MKSGFKLSVQTAKSCELGYWFVWMDGQPKGKCIARANDLFDAHNETLYAEVVRNKDGEVVWRRSREHAEGGE